MIDTMGGHRTFAAVGTKVPCADVDDLHLDQIETAQLAIDRHVEESEVAMIFCQFKADTDRPDMLGF